MAALPSVCWDGLGGLSPPKVTLPAPQPRCGRHPRRPAHCGDGHLGAGRHEDGEEASHHQKAAHRGNSG